MDVEGTREANVDHAISIRCALRRVLQSSRDELVSALGASTLISARRYAKRVRLGRTSNYESG